MNRREYLAASSAAHPFTMPVHRADYAQLVDNRTILHVSTRIGKAALLASTDPHLNDIPLQRWDEAAVMMPTARTFKSLDDQASAASRVCVAKEAARQWLEMHAEGQK